MQCAEEEVRIFAQAREVHEVPGGQARVFLETQSAHAMRQLIRREAFAGTGWRS